MKIGKTYKNFDGHGDPQHVSSVNDLKKKKYLI